MLHPPGLARSLPETVLCKWRLVRLSLMSGTCVTERKKPAVRTHSTNTHVSGWCWSQQAYHAVHPRKTSTHDCRSVMPAAVRHSVRFAQPQNGPTRFSEHVPIAGEAVHGCMWKLRKKPKILRMLKRGSLPLKMFPLAKPHYTFCLCPSGVDGKSKQDFSRVCCLFEMGEGLFHGSGFP